ncbi:TetR/AcrR family transcriptional regulator [Mycolicibacter arupensis]|jgi:AcrR family transcriptional regulator|uniref:TetR/AcrR family transcriptional regulator n=1 Tax=Mycolicibacter arupensis TaxID=342002 RepID=A0A5C7XR45_9MYCO|nr:TetR/AcrR family transcriptional regulator [Mycolicibacter arupensis]KAA1430203.1 TetR/AcrR family transcriptional regulator [Mycolicibacter arupensis]TXI51979.1 MAG: TetR/AcrR family transcriptional regulator [Mycolicibacter arupensis]
MTVASASPASASTTDRLLDATEKLLADKGIRATTMIDVAQAAGVSRAWLYRNFPDKPTLVGAALMRLIETSWAQAGAELATLTGFEEQLVAGVQIGRRAYDDPGTLLMRLRLAEPEEFTACAGAGVRGLVPDLAAFWHPFVAAAADAGDIHPDTDVPEASEWVARVMISLGSVPGNHMNPDDPAAVRRHLRRYVLPGLRQAP